MTATSITFEEMEARTERTFALAILAKSVRDGFRACTAGFVLLPYLAHSASVISGLLTTEFLEQLTDAQVRELADRLRILHGGLLATVRTLEHKPTTKIPLVGYSLTRIEKSTEDIGDILENIYLSLDPDFPRLVSNAITESKVTVKDIAAMHH